MEAAAVARAACPRLAREAAAAVEEEDFGPAAAARRIMRALFSSAEEAVRPTSTPLSS